MIEACISAVLSITGIHLVWGAQWLNGRVLDSRLRGRGLSLTCVTALWSLSKTHLA